MNTKQENKETSTSPKEKEKLKQRLQTLFKQQEQKGGKNKSQKSVQKKFPHNMEPQQVNGEPAKKPHKQNSSTQQNNERKSIKNKHINKINGLLNGGTGGRNINEKKSTKQREQDDSLGGASLEISRKQKTAKKSNKSKSLPSAATLQPEFQKPLKKNKKSKQNNEGNKPVAATPSELPNHKVSLGNSGLKKLNKNQKKNAKKRAAAAEPISEQKNESKKPKLAQQQTKNKSKKLKKQNIGLSNKLPTKRGVANNKFDVFKMSGIVKGGDFDQDSSEDEDYWNQDGPQESDDQYFEEDFYKQGTTFENSANDDGEFGDDPYNYSDYSVDEEDVEGEENGLEKHSSFDEDEDELGDDPYNYSDYSEDDEEEEENYSDFDEDDYEEDEDSFSYSSDSEFSSMSCGDDTENIYGSDAEEVEEDEDYKLPEHVPEDCIIHSGTATKRDLLPEDNVQFKDKKYMQILELKEQADVKVIRQPKEYQREELLKLSFKQNHNIKIIVDNKSDEKATSPSASECKDDCPKLVPIVDEEGFQLYNPNEEDDDDECMNEEEEGSYDEDASLGSEYTELDSDDADSLISEDINDKYLNRGNDDDVYYSSDDENAFLAAKRKVDVIDATNCDYNKASDSEKDENESIEYDQTPSHTLSRHVRVGIKVNVISTTVIDKEEDSTNSLNLSNATDDSMDCTMESETMLNTSSNDDNKSAEETVSASPVLEDTEEITKQTKQSANRLKTTAQSLAGYSTVFCNAINANLVLVLLKDPFYIYGTVRLTLLAGTVEVYGHPLAKDKEAELFSPRGCSEIEISSKQTPAKEQISKDKVRNILKHYETNFINSDLEQIWNAYNPEKDAVVLLKRNEERKKIVQQFKKFMNENVFPNLQNITMDRSLYDSEYLLRCMINISATEHKCLRLPEQWHKFAVSAQSRVMLIGGKGVGKSTLLRFLINQNIRPYEKVLLIDLDIGQPEIFVPQTVSCSIVQKPLLGPGFFLNIQPEKSYAVGNTNIALCPHTYVAAVRSLIKYCRAQEKFENIPWFVNTMGYNKGFGPELISVIASELALTDVIQLQSNKAINNYDSLLFPMVVKQIPRNMFVEDNENAQDHLVELSYRLHVWQSAVTQESRYQKEWDMSPKDMRYAILLTRLSEALQGHAEWLSDCKPLSAPLDQLKLVNFMDNIPPCSTQELAKAMEANLVYLCHYEDDQSSLECLGIGVVRAVDYHVRQVYLLPAMSSHALLKCVNCLALGEMPLPSSLFINQGSRVQKTAPFVYNTIEAKASKAIKQIYHRPTNFLKGKHKSLN